MDNSSQGWATSNLRFARDAIKPVLHENTVAKLERITLTAKHLYLAQKWRELSLTEKVKSNESV